MRKLIGFINQIFIMNKQFNNIKTNHTYEEYTRFFGRRFRKGKLFDYSLDQKHLLNPKRQYWLIKDKDGNESYYELPYNIHPTNEFNRFSLRRIFTSKPFISTASVICILGLGLASISLYGALKPVPKPIPVPPGPEPKPSDKLLNAFQAYLDRGEDPIPHFTIEQCGQIPILKFRKQTESNTAKSYLTVGYGKSKSYPIGLEVDVDISNSLIFDGLNSYEESIYYSESPMAPRKGNRDYQYQADNQVKQYQGESNKDRTCKYDNKPKGTYTIKEYAEDKAGKEVKDPFLYVVNENTVLTENNPDIDPDTKEVHKNSTKPTPIYDKDGKKTGYSIHLELHHELSVAYHYTKRIRYLSELDVNRFNYVTFDMVVDNQFNLVDSKVNEKYVVIKNLPILGPIEVPTDGELHTRYYLNNVPKIPDINTSFDYSKYPFN